MSQVRILRAVAVWFVLLVLAVANGTLREKGLVPKIGDRAGHVVSTVLLAAAILVVSWFAIPWIDPGTPARAWTVGLLWVAMTLAFEFGFGRVRGRSWRKLFADYDVGRGRVWFLVPITTLVAPWVVARLRG